MYQLSREGTHEIHFTSETRKSWLSLVLTLAFTAFWYAGLIQAAASAEPGSIVDRVLNQWREEPLLIVFYLAPLFILIPVILQTRRAALGESLIISKESNDITRNYRRLASLDDLQAIILETRAEIETGAESYQLSLELTRLPVLRVMQSSDYQPLRQAAEAISRISGLTPEYRRTRE